jgi:hypothetical protein
LKPVDLHVKNYASPYGVDTAKPLFAWRLESEERAQEQTHYRIVVRSDDRICWDSGKVASGEQLGVPYAGEPLESTTLYHWQVAVWNREGRMEWSEPQPLFTGYLNPAEWKAAWIGTGKDKPFYARFTFHADKPVKRAFALVSGLGHFQCFMNGEKVGDHKMDPGWTNYHRSVQYVAFDVTDRIAAGENVIALHVGNGFFLGDAGGRHFYTIGQGYEPFGEALMAMGEWHIEYADGSAELIVTGRGSWKVRESAVTLANAYGSENYDARRYPNGWNDAGFDDSHWEDAVILAPPQGRLVCQNQPPITVKKVYDAVTVTEPKDQVYVFDFGQNMSAMFEIYVSGPAGSVVKVFPGELQNEDGTVAAPWNIKTYSEYTLAGTGEVEVWKPDFSCYGARWVQIEGCTRDASDTSKPFIHDVKAYFVTSAAEDVGELETDDPRMTKLAHIILKAIESNLQSVHTDCPTMEKLGWLETSQLMGPSIMYVKQVEELWLKIVRDMIEAQTEEGLIPDIAPEYSRFKGGFRDSIAWGSAIIIIPELLLQTYGNRTAIEEAYPAMKAYMSYLNTKETEEGFIRHGLGDWGIEPGAGGDYVENVETAFYYYDNCLLAKFADMLGRKDEAAYYSQEAERIKQNYNRLLLKQAYCKANGEYDPNNQVVQALPLMLGLVPEERRADVEAALLQAASSRQLRSGEIGLRYLFGALAATGHNDIVLDMMMQPEHPSYIRFVEMGETALPEFWEDAARSRNHDMLGHILEWMYRELLGISSVRNAYQEIRIAPFYTPKLKSIRGKHRSVRGTIEVDFSHTADEVKLSVTIPPNTSALVRLPLISLEGTIHESGHPADCDVVTEAGQHYALIRILSGRYDFVHRSVPRS